VLLAPVEGGLFYCRLAAQKTARKKILNLLNAPNFRKKPVNKNLLAAFSDA
jgi:hypothetical protein